MAGKAARLRNVALAGGAAVLAACHPASATRTATSRPSVTLSVLPAESGAYPKVATALNQLFAGDLRVPGVDMVRHSKVSLQVAQLSIECVDPTPACYQSVGRSLGADRLLFGLVEKGRTRKAPVRVQVELFDVDRGTTIFGDERTFASQARAVGGLKELLDEVTELGRGAQDTGAASSAPVSAPTPAPARAPDQESPW